MNRTRPVIFEPLENRELFAADIGFCNSHFDQPARHDLFEHRADFAFATSRNPLASSVGTHSSSAEGESNSAAGLSVARIVAQPPTTFSFVVREVFVTPIVVISSRGSQSGITLVSRPSSVSEHRSAPAAAALTAASDSTIWSPAVSEVKLLALTTNRTPTSTNDEWNRLTSPNNVVPPATHDRTSANSQSTLNEVAVPVPSGMVPLSSDGLSAWNRFGFEKPTDESFPANRSRSSRSANHVEPAAIASTVFTTPRPDNPLPIPADMVYLDLDTRPTPTSSNVDYLFGEMGMNPLALFQTFLHSQPVEVVQTSESSVVDAETEPDDSRNNNSLTSTSVGIIAVASAVFFAFSPRKHRSVKLDSQIRHSDEPTA